MIGAFWVVKMHIKYYSRVVRMRDNEKVGIFTALKHLHEKKNNRRQTLINISCKLKSQSDLAVNVTGELFW